MTRRSGGSAPTQRQLRVGEELRHVLASVLARGELRDPALQDVSITVTQVRVSPDLRNATAYVMPLGGRDEAPVVEALNKLSRAFRGALAKRLREMRSMPDVRFRIDNRFDAASHIDALLNDPRVRRDLEKKDDTDA